MASAYSPASRPRFFRLLGLGCALAGLGAVGATAIRGTVGDSRPDGFAGLARGSVAALRHALDRELSLSRGATIATPHEDKARQLLAAAPLDPTALTYLALAAQGRGDMASAQRLMTLALRRDERSVRARLWLMDQDLRRRDYADAIEHFDRLVRLGPPGRDDMVVAMAAVARDPASHAPLARKLATNPPWRSSFLLALNRQGISPNVIFGLTPQNASRPQALVEQAALLRSLLAKHEYERAYLAWVNFLPPASLAQVGPVFDPDFRQLTGPEPFNWHLTDGVQGSAEFARPAGLTVTYLGAVPATLAEQTLLLPAGRYQLSVVASGADESNQLAWTVTCTGGGEPLASVALTGLDTGRHRYRGTFEIPAAGCGSQRLALIGQPTEFPRTAEATIALVQIDPGK